MTEKRFFKIDESTLRSLLEDSEKLAALEYGGVDNWNGYDDAFEMYQEDNEAILEASEFDLSQFEEIK